MPFDLAKAPFRYQLGTDPAQVAGEIVDCFGVAARLSDKLTQATCAAMEVIGLPAESSLFRAAHRLARDIDAGIGNGGSNPYHNSQHFCEVLLSALYLSLPVSLGSTARAQLLMAALAHDFHHDGTSSKETPFRLERLAAEAVIPYLDAAGVPAADQARVTAMILATETTAGVPFARQCYRRLASGQSTPVVPPAEMRLGALAADAELALQAVLLTEADLLPSVGLTIDYGERCQAKLASEWGTRLTTKDKLFFLERVFGDFEESRFFSPNVQRLKDAMRGMADSAESKPV